MAGIKEIRTRIDSVQQTLKITNAMYLISSSKLRKARQQFNAVQPFFQKVTETISDILHHSPAMEHVYFDKRPHVSEHTVGYIVITGDKGLAGAYNHNRGAACPNPAAHAVFDWSGGTQLFFRAGRAGGWRIHVHGPGPDIFPCGRDQ